MTSDVDDPMAAEFGTVAQWTAQVAADLGAEYFIPAACRGSGQPAALDWLLARLAPAPGDLIIDVGAGVGGPAAYAAGQAGVQPILIEPEHDACRAAARLFGAPVIEADATALPLADATAGLIDPRGKAKPAQPVEHVETGETRTDHDRIENCANLWRTFLLIFCAGGHGSFLVQVDTTGDGCRGQDVAPAVYIPRSSRVLKSARTRCASFRAVSDASPRPK